MSIGNKIQEQRKSRGMTQEALAQALGVTNQAVSKWETDQSVPDTMLLPAIADVLGISIDALFGRETGKMVPAAEGKTLPWEDDDAFHVVVFCGHELVGENPVREEVTFCYEGPVKDLYCEVNVSCDSVQGNVSAGGYVECGDVYSSVDADGYVECGDVYGSINAGGYVECADVKGKVTAGGYVECGDVGDSVIAGDYVECSDVGGCAVAGTYVDREDDDTIRYPAPKMEKDGEKARKSMEFRDEKGYFDRKKFDEFMEEIRKKFPGGRKKKDED